MNSFVDSGNQRLLDIEFQRDSILWFCRHPPPCARMDAAAATASQKTANRGRFAGGGWPTPYSVPAANPAGIREVRLRVSLKECAARCVAQSAPRAPACCCRLSGCVARGFPEPLADGASDCGALPGVGRDTRV